MQVPPSGKRVPLVRRAFTLVELLVVIGIIAVLIAILLPALAGARMEAKRVACMANLRSIGQASLMHANEHHQYFPLAGHIWTGGGATATGVNDPQQQRYVYFSDGGTLRVMPVPGALAQYLGQNVRSDTRANLTTDLATGTVRNVFLCPADEQLHQGNTIQDSGWVGPLFYDSYVFNEAALGWYDGGNITRSRGELARMRNPTEMVYLCDGQPRTEWSDSLMDLYDGMPDVTLKNAYFWNGAGTPSMFDKVRHRGRMNVLFFDGHAETIWVTPESLDSVSLNKGLN